jgi:SNF2 family DNA or RNA helicase
MTVNYNFKLEPFEHQKQALTAAGRRPEFGFFMEMGTGKSKVLLDNIGQLYLAGLVNFALIIAPKGVYRNWVTKEIPEHISDDVPHRVIRWVASPNKKQQLELKSVADRFDGLTIFVMNVEAFSSLKGQQAGKWLATKFGAYGLIGIDESTTIKNHKAKRTKALMKIAAGFAFRRLLTGSPVTKSPLDLYGQTEFLRPGLLGFDSFYAFQGRYAVLNKRTMGAKSFQQIVGYKNLEELTWRVDQFSFRVLKKDCLDLPEKTYTARYVTLTPEQRAMYESIQSQAMHLFENGQMVTAPAVITQLLRLQQVMSGHLKTDDGEIKTFPSTRMDALADILEEHDGKAIIWSRFRYDIVNIVEMLNKKFGEGSSAAYYGDTSDDERNWIVGEFQKPQSRLKFFVGNPATAGYGLTLTEANLVVYYANDFNLETRIQSEDRAHRIGQRNPVTYVDLISEGTIDEKIVAALRAKIEIGAKVLGEEAREWLSLKPSRPRSVQPRGHRADDRVQNRVAQRGQRHPGHGSHDRAPARHLQGLARHEQEHDRAADTRLLKDAGAIGRREKKKGCPKAA